MNRLPDHLTRELGRGQCEPDTWRIVTQLELFGVPVVVRRLQLGDMRADGLGQWEEIYRTTQEKEGNDADKRRAGL